MSLNERMYVVEGQKVTVEREIKGERILDIGGGGEGIIGLCYEKKMESLFCGML